MKTLVPISDQLKIQEQIISQAPTWDIVVCSKKKFVPCVQRNVHVFNANKNAHDTVVISAFLLAADPNINLKYYKIARNMNNFEWKNEEKKIKSLQFSKNTRLVLNFPEVVCITNDLDNSEKIILLPGKFYTITAEANQPLIFYDPEKLE